MITTTTTNSLKAEEMYPHATLRTSTVTPSTSTRSVSLSAIVHKSTSGGSRGGSWHTLRSERRITSPQKS